MENIIKNKSYYSEIIYPNWVKTNAGREQYFNLKNTKKDMEIGDCVLRAIALANDESYYTVWKDMFTLASKMGFFPNDNRVSEKFLLTKGFQKYKLSNKRGYIRTNELYDESPNFHYSKIGFDIPHIKDKWIICHITNHWVASYNNVFYDQWDSYGKNSFNDHPVLWNMYIQ